MKIIADDLSNYHCPRWNELPDIELYIDQVICILQNNLSIFIKEGDAIITTSMINNYVKNKVIKAPVKKKYTRDQVTHLFVICIFKKLMSISDISESIKYMKRIYTVEEGYNIFCDELEKALKNTFGSNPINEIILVESDTREISTLKAIVAAFSKAIMVDRLISLRE